MVHETGRSDGEAATMKHLKALLACAEFRKPGVWKIVERVEERPLAVSWLRLNACGCRIMIVVDLAMTLSPEPATLKRVFGLTTAEARLAVLLAAGRTPTEIAKLLKVSTTTVRSQLASIFDKTHTHRQPELVSLLARISMVS